MNTVKTNQFLYQAKFPEHGEIGFITFKKKYGRYFELKFRNQIKPLYFIEKFKKYRVSDTQITVGEARINFIKGTLYETLPLKSLFFFKGTWEFYLKPNNKEEKLTLIRKYKNDYFLKSSNIGMFILYDRDFLSSLSEVREVKKIDADLLSMFKIYKNIYGTCRLPVIGLIPSISGLYDGTFKIGSCIGPFGSGEGKDICSYCRFGPRAYRTNGHRGIAAKLKGCGQELVNAFLRPYHHDHLRCLATNLETEGYRA